MVDIYWYGGVELFRFKRDLGKIINNYHLL